MATNLLPLAIALLLLMIDAAIELAFISSMVGYLHRSRANKYRFFTISGISSVNAKPRILLTDQGHTSNGAAGTALVLICFGGAWVLWRQIHRERTKKACGLSKVFLAWTVLTILGFLLTLAALIYTFTINNQTSSQSIDVAVAVQHQGDAYPLLRWTPQTWTNAVLTLPLVETKDMDYLLHWRRDMEAWQWNLIPMMIFNLGVALLAIKECAGQTRRVRERYKPDNVADSIELRPGK